MSRVLLNIMDRYEVLACIIILEHDIIILVFDTKHSF